MTVATTNIIANEAVVAMDRIERLAPEQGSGDYLKFVQILPAAFGEFQILRKLTGVNRGIH